MGPTIILVVVLWLALVIPLIFILTYLFKSKDNPINQQVIDLKNQINELKTKQLRLSRNIESYRNSSKISNLRIEKL